MRIGKTLGKARTDKCMRPVFQPYREFVLGVAAKTVVTTRSRKLTARHLKDKEM